VLGSTAARTILGAAWLFPLAYAASLGCTRDHPEPQTFEVRAEPTKPPDPYEHSASRFGTVPLHAGFSPDPRVVAGTAAGEVPADSVHRKCRGWIAKTPDYLLDADTAFFQLHVLGRSKEDVVLIVRKPDGSVLCNDNRPGTHDPMIRSDFPIGTTQVWVGVKEKGSRAPYRLGFSEVKWKSSSISLPDKN
jgi:hypothetical protein